MTKQELIESLVRKQTKRSISKAAASDVVESLFDNLAFGIRRGKRFSYPGFGTFVVRKRKARKGRNPQTGQELMIDASKTVVFRPSDFLRDRLR